MVGGVQTIPHGVVQPSRGKTVPDTHYSAVACQFAVEPIVYSAAGREYDRVKLAEIDGGAGEYVVGVDDALTDGVDPCVRPQVNTGSA